MYKNPRQTERAKSKKSSSKFEAIPIKIVNSEGCILLREQTALLDAQNGNRPKEKTGSAAPKPLKGILKNANPYNSGKGRRKHINYKYSWIDFDPSFLFCFETPYYKYNVLSFV